MQTLFRESNRKQHCVIEWSRDDRSLLNNKANRFRRNLSLEIDTCIDASLRSKIAMNWYIYNLKQRINLFTKKYTVSPHLQSILSFLAFFAVFMYKIPRLVALSVPTLTIYLFRDLERTLGKKFVVHSSVVKNNTKESSSLK